MFNTFQGLGPDSNRGNENIPVEESKPNPFIEFFNQQTQEQNISDLVFFGNQTQDVFEFEFGDDSLTPLTEGASQQNNKSKQSGPRPTFDFNPRISESEDKRNRIIHNVINANIRNNTIINTNIRNITSINNNLVETDQVAAFVLSTTKQPDSNSTFLTSTSTTTTILTTTKAAQKVDLQSDLSPDLATQLPPLKTTTLQLTTLRAGNQENKDPEAASPGFTVSPSISSIQPQTNLPIETSVSTSSGLLEEAGSNGQPNSLFQTNAPLFTTGNIPSSPSLPDSNSNQITNIQTDISLPQKTSDDTAHPNIEIRTTNDVSTTETNPITKSLNFEPFFEPNIPQTLNFLVGPTVTSNSQNTPEQINPITKDEDDVKSPTQEYVNSQQSTQNSVDIAADQIINGTSPLSTLSSQSIDTTSSRDDLPANEKTNPSFLSVNDQQVSTEQSITVASSSLPNELVTTYQNTLSPFQIISSNPSINSDNTPQFNSLQTNSGQENTFSATVTQESSFTVQPNQEKISSQSGSSAENTPNQVSDFVSSGTPQPPVTNSHTSISETSEQAIASVNNESQHSDPKQENVRISESTTLPPATNVFSPLQTAFVEKSLLPSLNHQESTTPNLQPNDIQSAAERESQFLVQTSQSENVASSSVIQVGNLEPSTVQSLVEPETVNSSSTSQDLGKNSVNAQDSKSEKNNAPVSTKQSNDASLPVVPSSPHSIDGNTIPLSFVSQKDPAFITSPPPQFDQISSLDSLITSGSISSASNENPQVSTQPSEPINQVIFEQPIALQHDGSLSKNKQTEIQPSEPITEVNFIQPSTALLDKVNVDDNQNTELSGQDPQKQIFFELESEIHPDSENLNNSRQRSVIIKSENSSKSIRTVQISEPDKIIFISQSSGTPISFANNSQTSIQALDPRIKIIVPQGSAIQSEPNNPQTTELNDFEILQLAKSLENHRQPSLQATALTSEHLTQAGVVNQSNKESINLENIGNINSASVVSSAQPEIKPITDQFTSTLSPNIQSQESTTTALNKQAVVSHPSNSPNGLQDASLIITTGPPATDFIQASFNRSTSDDQQLTTSNGQQVTTSEDQQVNPTFPEPSGSQITTSSIKVSPEAESRIRSNIRVPLPNKDSLQINIQLDDKALTISLPYEESSTSTSGVEVEYLGIIYK